MGRRVTANGTTRISPAVFRQSETYRRYLASPEWQARRAAILKRDDGKCRRCGGVATDVHHRTYDRLGRERDTDLESLCRSCHQKADTERAREAQGNAWNARVDGWASKRYGDDWDAYMDVDAVEDDFDRWLDSQA